MPDEEQARKALEDLGGALRADLKGLGVEVSITEPPPPSDAIKAAVKEALAERFGQGVARGNSQPPGPPQPPKPWADLEVGERLEKLRELARWQEATIHGLRELVHALQYHAHVDGRVVAAIQDCRPSSLPSDYDPLA